MTGAFDGRSPAWAAAARKVRAEISFTLVRSRYRRR